MNLMADYHANASIGVGINSSFITLIPKKSSTPTVIPDYRLISLIGCV